MFDNQVMLSVNRPARYTGNEWNSIVKDWDETAIKVALAYPDTYEIGMSNMAIPILYEILNGRPDVLAERVFAPWADMEAVLREKQVPLFSLETKHPLGEFDIIGFSLGYELAYTNVLNMLDLAGIPVLAPDRNDSHPLVIAGGSCCLNPEPMSDFIDAFVIGDGEEVILEFMEVFRECKQQKAVKKDLLLQLAKVSGVYVPSLYNVEYDHDGLPKSITPVAEDVPAVIERRIVNKLPPPVTRPVVPFIEVIHDRGAVEVQRGCSRGCRFCQAGMIYRPVRERSHEEVIRAVGEIIENCGYDEVSLVSLNTTDYTGIDELIKKLGESYPGTALSLPSLHLDDFSVKLADSLPSRRRTGLTFAPEAGSDSLRAAINKDVTENDLLETAVVVFRRGWTGIKLYFMIGLPTETDEDVAEIVSLVEKVRAVGRQSGGRTPTIRISATTFVPKPHTPYQWSAQAEEEKLNARHEILKQGLRHKSTRLSWGDTRTSLLEAVMSRGDRRVGEVIKRAWELGCRFDAWSEHFNFDNWMKAFTGTGLEPGFYAHRERSLDELLPWSHIRTGVSDDFLKNEYRLTQEGRKTADCRTSACNCCGLQYLEVCSSK